MWYVLGGIALVIVVFLWWRYTSVERGARAVDRKILELVLPIGNRLKEGADVAAEEVEALAAKAHVRPMLYAMLKDLERLDLFPERYRSAESRAEGILAYWLMHPNELQDAPEEIELVETLCREVCGQEGDFYVLRFKMGDGHWAAKDGWLLGLAGPFRGKDVPYSGRAGAFSRCGDKEGEVSPSELVDWFVDMIERKVS